MRNTLKISYSCYIKNPKRPSAHYYGRVRESGLPVMDIDLHTKVKAVAESWVALRRDEVKRYNQYVVCGEKVPADLERSIVRRNSPLVIAQKASSEAVNIVTVGLDGWERDLRRVGRRERTIAVYSRALKNVVPKEALVTDINEDNIRLWLSKFDHLKSATRKHYSVATREFVRYCVKRYGIDRNLLDSFDYVKVETAERPYWTMNQMYHIIEAVEHPDKAVERLYKAYFWVMATVGSRQQETADLRWDDFRDGCLTFRAETTKSGETRRVPLDWRIADMLARLPRDGAMMFGAVSTVTQAARYAVLRKAVTKSGMPFGSLHTFRHSVSMLMYKSTNDIKATAQLLGHKELTALKYYQASRQADELRQVVDKVYEGENLIPSPMDRLIDEGLI